MTREEAHKLVDQFFDAEVTAPNPAEGLDTSMVDTSTESMTGRVLPEGKRVIRTNTSGDRVYFLDDVKMTRQWVTNPEVLDSLGFELGDVVEIDEDEMLKYQMAPALYKRVDED